jgi:hypothetical protein
MKNLLSAIFTALCILFGPDPWAENDEINREP